MPTTEQPRIVVGPPDANGIAVVAVHFDAVRFRREPDQTSRPSGPLVRAPVTSIVIYIPEWPFVITNVRLTTERRGVDIDQVIVGHLSLAAFRKRVPVCTPAEQIRVFVESEDYEETGLVIEGKALVGVPGAAP